MFGIATIAVLIVVVPVRTFGLRPLGSIAAGMGVVSIQEVLNALAEPHDFAGKNSGRCCIDRDYPIRPVQLYDVKVCHGSRPSY
jgi:hypothetical protein